MSKTFAIETLGCQMNEHDSENISKILTSSGYKENNENYDVLVINTCSVRENAINKLYGHLGAYSHKKNLTLVVCGCAAELLKEKLFKRAPNVNILLGTKDYESLPHLLSKSFSGLPHLSKFSDLNTPTPFISERSKTTNYVNISTGCNNKCTYCIVPMVRGPEIDREESEIIKECEEHVENGTVEIVLLGQNVNSYGVSFGKKDAFPSLLEKISEIDGLKRIRFESPHPAYFTNRLIDTISLHSNIMPYLHLPLQSGSDTVLKDMGRIYTTSKFEKIVNYARKTIPSVSITTDIIVGFPTETDDYFKESLEFVKKMNFDNAYTFIYSPRPGTKSTDYKTLSSEVCKKRYQILQDAQEKISQNIYDKFLGTTQIVMLSEKQNQTNKENISGRTNDYKLVHYKPKVTKVNTFATVKIEKATPYFLVGKEI